MRGYGCPGLSSVAFGLAMQEIGSGRLVVRDLLRDRRRSGAGHDRHLRIGGAEGALAATAGRRCEAIGAFALTEPDHGSDASHLATRARRDGDDYVLDGAKRWIGNATICDVAVVWARAEEGIAGFLVERPNARFRRDEDRRQTLAARRLAGRHPAGGVPRPGRQPAAGRRVPGGGRGARPGAPQRRLARPGGGDRLLRDRPRLRAAAGAVRQADRRLSTRPGQAGARCWARSPRPNCWRSSSAACSNAARRPPG